jgi:hypothetical protein
MSNRLTEGDVSLVLDDLFENKIGLLEQAKAFAIYRPALEERREKLAAVRKALEGRPLSEELKTADLVHDSTGRALHLICTGLGQLVTLDQDQRNLLARIQKTFVPTLGDLQKSYEDEAAAAARRRPALEEMEAELKAFPVAPEMTMHTLVSSYIDAGQQIDVLLSKRATATAEETSGREAESVAIRSETVGLLGRFRSALADEIAMTPELQRDLEAKVFAYYDQLSQSREDRSAKPKPQTPIPES